MYWTLRETAEKSYSIKPQALRQHNSHIGLDPEGFQGRGLRVIGFRVRWAWGFGLRGSYLSSGSSLTCLGGMHMIRTQRSISEKPYVLDASEDDW